jgi:predicted transposase/invertase (TIGR01784 family)
LHPPDDDPQRPWVYVEVQFAPKRDFYSRLFSEIFLHLRLQQKPRPWHAVVVYPDRATERLPPPGFTSLLQLPELHRVYLEDFLEKEPTEPQGALTLIPLLVCPSQQVDERVRQAVQQTAPPLPADEWLDLIETILVYKLPHLTRKEIQHMIGIKDIDLKQTRFYQDVFTEGRLEGRLEGESEGKKKGRLEGEIILLQRLLEQKFGPLAPPLQQRLSLADDEMLLHWGERMLEATTLDEVFRSS